MEKYVVFTGGVGKTLFRAHRNREIRGYSVRSKHR